MYRIFQAGVLSKKESAHLPYSTPPGVILKHISMRLPHSSQQDNTPRRTYFQTAVISNGKSAHPPNSQLNTTRGDNHVYPDACTT